MPFTRRFLVPYIICLVALSPGRIDAAPKNSKTNNTTGDAKQKSAAISTENRVAAAAKILGIAATGNQDLLVSEEKARASFEKLTQIANSANRTIAIEEAKRAESAAVKKTAWGKFQPGINLFAGQSRSDARTLEPADPSVTSGSDKKEVGINLRFNLFNGGADWSAVKAADRGLSAADFSTEASRLRVALNARKAIVAYNQAAMELRLAEAAAASAAEIRSMSLRKLNAGVVGKIDLHKTEVRESEASAQALQAKLALEQAKVNLLRNCGIDLSRADTVTDLVTPLEQASLPLPDTDKIKSLVASYKSDASGSASSASGNPENKETLTEKIATLQSEKSALEASAAYRKRWIPAVDLTASLSRDQAEPRGDAAIGRDSTSKSQSQMIGLELNWKLWAPGEDGSVAAAVASRDRAALTAAESRETANAARSELVARIRSLVETLQVLRQTWELASRLYDAESELYQAGAVDIFELINSESQRLAALRSWHQSRYAMHVALLQWESLDLGLVSDSSL